MITQRGSRLPHAKDFGCYAYSLAHIVAKAAKKELLQEKIDDIIELAIKLHFILDNDITIKPGNEWYRCFVLYPIHYMQLIAKTLNIPFANPPAEIYRGKQREPIEETTDTIIELETKTWSHFTTPDYDPWPELERTGKIKSVRFWRLKFWRNAYEPT